MPLLGRLSAVQMRTVWAHEAHDFTPRLLAHADVLGEVLDMSLELHAAEHPVGSFALNLVGVDVDTNEKAIVENQLEVSDHTHLGQILTYAGGTDPVNIVWVAPQFRDEHRAALDWLNTRTDETTRFFAVEVSVVRIGDSAPAPLLKLAVAPNGWGKRIRTTTDKDASSTATKYQESWTMFIAQLQATRVRWATVTKPPLASWISMSAGVRGITFGSNFSRQGLRTEVWFGDPDPEVNDRWYTAMLARKTEFEAAYGGPLAWEPLPRAKGSRIAFYTPGSIDNRDAWSDYANWFIRSQTRLRQAFAGLGGVASAVTSPG